MFKNLNKFIPVFIFSVAILFLSGCQDSEITNSNPADDSLLDKMLPMGASLTSAKLNLYVSTSNSQQVNVHRITSDWVENSVTWNNFAAAFAPAQGISFQADLVGYKEVDVTDIVQGWVDGSYPDYGILLDQVDKNYPRAQYHGRTNTNKPFIEMCYTVGNESFCDTVFAVSDAYIWQSNPDNNYDTPWLYTGWANTADLEKQSLLRFDIEPTPYPGCTLTQGYWKTHSSYGPAPYNETWALIGEDTPFFSSNRSYYQVLWKRPIGNPYYILAHQYIAAKLNILKGADPGAIQSEYDAATDLFNNYTPMQIAVMRHNNQVKRQFVQLGFILGKYNLGLIGPGHCGCNNN